MFGMNPWTGLPAKPPFILPGDEAILPYIVPSVPPEPFTGNVLEAPIVLLNLNPGYDKQDEDFYARPDVMSWSRSNLEHQHGDYPFWLLHPELSNWSAYKWWYKRFRSLIEALANCEEDPVQAIARKVAVIEWFPYHSVTFKKPPVASVGQPYSWCLAREALDDRDRIVLVMRSLKLWQSVLGSLEGVPTLAPQNPALTPEQLGEALFASLVEVISPGCPPTFTKGDATAMKTILERVQAELEKRGWQRVRFDGKFVRMRVRKGTDYSVGFRGQPGVKKTLVEFHIYDDKPLFYCLQKRMVHTHLNDIKLQWEPLPTKKASRVALCREPDFAKPEHLVALLVADALALRDAVDPLLPGC